MIDKNQVKDAIKEIVEENRKRQIAILVKVILVIDLTFTGMLIGLGAFVLFVAYIGIKPTYALLFTIVTLILIMAILFSLLTWKNKK